MAEQQAAAAEIVDFASRLQQQADARERFDALIAPLEVRAGQRLGGDGREACFTAFCQNPDGFRPLIEKARKRAARSPLGLLVRFVRDGEHTLAPLREEPSNRSMPVDDCARCGVRRPLVDDAGLYCEACE